MLMFKQTNGSMVSINAEDIKEVNEWRDYVTRILLKYAPGDELFIDGSFKEVMEQIHVNVHR